MIANVIAIEIHFEFDFHMCLFVFYEFECTFFDQFIVVFNQIYPLLSLLCEFG